MARWKLKALRPLAVNAALALVSTAFALTLAELILRKLPDQEGAHRYGAHPIWHHWLRPNQRTELLSFDSIRWPQPIVYKTNAWGCRYGEIQDAPHRTLVMGDSFTEGYYIEDTFAAVLERRTGHQVIGCASSSYSPLLHYLRYRDHLSKLKPDELIVNVDLTDIYDDNRRYGPSAVFAADGTPLRAGDSRWQYWADELRFRSRLARLVLGRMRDHELMPTPLNVFAYHRGMPVTDPIFKQDMGRTLDHLKRLVDLAKSHGVAVTITTYPYQYQLRAGTRGEPLLWNRNLELALAYFAHREKVAFWSAFDALEPHADSIYWSFDAHFTPSGQRIWANAFADYYLSQNPTSSER